MPQQIEIPARFNGPPNSGNGGYSCGVIAAFIDGPARVRLHQPPPLDHNMDVRDIENQAVGLFDGDNHIGTAWPAEFELDCPTPPSLDEAQAARNISPLYDNHPLASCFVCGTARQPEDGLCLHCGPVGGWHLLACNWTPQPDLLNEQGLIRDEIIWSALDCPGFAGCYGDDPAMALLGELEARILKPIPGQQELVVYAWPLGRDGRKGWGGAAIASAEGEIYAYSRSLWIELKS